MSAADVSSGAKEMSDVAHSERRAVELVRSETPSKKAQRARGPARDMRSQAYRRFVEDERPIVAVTRKRLAVDYFGRDYQPRLVSISLARVAGYFEELPS